MKLSIFFKVLLISSLAFVAVGCGKDAKKKSGQDYNYYNPYTSGGVTSTPTASGQTAIANLNNYINAQETNSSLIGPVNVLSQRYACKNKELLGINFLPYESCSYTSVSVQRYATPGAVRSAQNPSLAGVLTSPSGYTLGNVVQYGNLVVVEHYLQGATIETVQYSILLDRHAVSNPVMTKDTVNKRIDQVYSPSI